MDDEFKELLSAVLAEHPGPWRQMCGFTDGGAPYDAIKDANGGDVFDGESGTLSESVFNLLLNFPEIAADLGLSRPSTITKPTGTPAHRGS